MKGYFKVIAIIIVMVFMVTGCSKKESEAIRNHKASLMKENGVWDERFSQYSCVTSDDSYLVKLSLSVDVITDMTEQDMMEVLDYYELQMQEQTETNIGNGDVVEIYAEFYKQDTDEELMKAKYVNGEIEEYTADEESNFLPPDIIGSDSEEE